ncbi:MAG TPA: endonuclease III [Candidatus Limnocylindrales bacterium]|nr:endonuclease III [Candidatus Limnocylindrales bacterium]
MPRESTTDRRKRARRIAKKLFAAHPDATIALSFRNPFELICATVLSAQCTDERVNKTTPALFERFPDARSMAGASPDELENLIRSTGFYRAKARSLLGLASAITTAHRGVVPKTMEELVELPGVGRKTANVVLGNAYGTPGIVVDTHVRRVSGRLELTASDDPVEIESDLMQLIERADWTMFSHAMIFHGRRICIARKPKCPECPLLDDCPFPKRAGIAVAPDRVAGRTDPRAPTRSAGGAKRKIPS